MEINIKLYESKGWGIYWLVYIYMYSIRRKGENAPRIPGITMYLLTPDSYYYIPLPPPEL